MQTLKLTSHIDQNGHLRLDVSTNLPAGGVELILVIEPARARSLPAPAYDFSDLAGALHWSGDAVAEHRKLRDAGVYFLN